MIELIHDAGGQTDLVAVRRIARRGGCHQFALGEFAGHGFGDRLQGIGGSGDAHGAVDIRASGERVADRAADAGGGSAKGLDLRRVVVGFIFEQQQPGFPNAVGLHLDLDGAGVDFL